MPRARLKAGRQAQELGAAIIETWLKLIPTPATIASVDSSSGQPLKITVNRQIFSDGQKIRLRTADGLLTTDKLTVRNPTSAADYKQQFSMFKDDGATPEPTSTNFANGIAILELASVSAQLKNELKAVLAQIVDGVSPEPVFDDVNTMFVAVPRVPENVLTRDDLLKYLRAYHEYGQGRHYHDELGAAVLFGCR